MPIEKTLINSLRYYLVAFDAAGNKRDEAGGLMSEKIMNVLSSEPVTDVFLFSHGWLHDIPAARRQ